MLRFAHFATTADLEGSDLSGVDTQRACLNRANLRKPYADFLNASLKGANFHRATLHHAKNLARTQLREARKSLSSIFASQLQPSLLSAPRQRPDLQRTGAPRRTEGKGVLRIWIAGAAVAMAALFFVGVVWEPISRALWLTQLEQSFGTPEELPSLPTTLSFGNARVSQPISSGASQIFAASPETELQERGAVAVRILRSQDLLPDQPPSLLSSVGGNRRAIAPRTAKLRKLLPVAKIRKFRVRAIAKVPVDTDVHRTVGNSGSGATVIASYYGREFAGRPTASGEKFNPSGMTAAHRTLPLGTRVEVTHAHNGRSVVVRINDRGPFIKGRSIDLSAGAARAIGLGGLGRVHLDVLR